MKLEGINKALKEGCKITGFVSLDGKLRVVQIVKDEKLKGYAEGFNIEDALTYADKSFLANGQIFQEVYGDRYPGTLKTDPTIINLLDRWLKNRKAFRCFGRGDQVIFQIYGLMAVSPPKEICEKAKKSGEPVIWENRGFIYEVTCEIPQNPMIYKHCGETITTKAIKRSARAPKGKHKEWFYNITKTGGGKNFNEAMKNALKAPEAEVDGGQGDD